MKDVETRLNYEIKKSWRKRLKENEQFCQNRARGNRAKGQSRKERNRKRSLKKEPEKEQRKKEIATDIGKNGEKSYLGNVKSKDGISIKNVGNNVYMAMWGVEKSSSHLGEWLKI